MEWEWLGALVIGLLWGIPDPDSRVRGHLEGPEPGAVGDLRVLLPPDLAGDPDPRAPAGVARRETAEPAVLVARAAEARRRAAPREPVKPPAAPRWVAAQVPSDGAGDSGRSSGRIIGPTHNVSVAGRESAVADDAILRGRAGFRCRMVRVDQDELPIPDADRTARAVEETMGEMLGQTGACHPPRDDESGRESIVSGPAVDDAGRLAR